MASTPQRAPFVVRLVHQFALHKYHFYIIAGMGTVLMLGTLFAGLTGANRFNMELTETRGIDIVAARAMEANVPSIFADRRHIVNALFVKRAWFWNTMAILLLACTVERASDGLRGEKALGIVPRRVTSWQTIFRMKSYWRWAIATLGWIFFTQWCFGPSISERVLVATGAACIVNAVPVDSALCYKRMRVSHATHTDIFLRIPPPMQEKLGSQTILARWHGGHDVSGHTFILVLGTVLLLEQLIPYLPYLLPSASRFRRSIPRALYANKDVFRALGWRDCAADALAVLTTIALCTLWVSMLCLTAVYFHSPQEKGTGFISALLVWLCIPKQSIYPL